GCYTILYSSSSDKIEESANETDDVDEFDMDLLDDYPDRDDDATGYGVFMHTKSTATPNSTYLSPTVTSSTLDFIQTLLDETTINELTNFMSHTVYTDAQTTSMVHNPEGNLELTSYISGASEVPLDQEDENVRNHPNPEWFLKKSGLANAKKRTTWFDLLLKSDIDQNKNHILGPSTVTIAKKIKTIIQKDELTITDLKVLIEAKWNSDEDEVSKPKTFKQHMSKYTKPHHSFYNNDFYYLVSLSTEEKYTTSISNHHDARYYKQGIEDMISDRWSKETHRYIFEALNDLPRLSLNDAEDTYLFQVQDKLHHLPLEFVKDFNNALLLLIKRVVIQNRVEDIQLGVLLFNSRLKIFSGKLKSRWSGPFTIAKIYPYGTAKLIHPDGCNFKVNCHRLKHYHRGDLPPLEIPDVTTFPKNK
nr:reverse transcriptase domain-containing protein [Tanacetum cinerariifolium]